MFCSVLLFKYFLVDQSWAVLVAIDKVNGYFEESNKKKYLGLVATDESKDTLKKYGEIWSKIGDLNGSLIRDLK